MKTIIIMIALLAIGCQDNSLSNKDGKLSGIGEVNVVTVDSCEYVVYQGSSQGGIIHKQNCKFCLARK